jgi:microcystin-dependent protein
MADNFLGEIRAFAGNFAPTGWALCNGQLLPISQNTALFSLLGTNYGGDGKSTFGLPNLQGRVPMHAGAGAGPGLTQRFPGESVGSDAVALSKGQGVEHRHTMLSAASTTDTVPSASVMLAPTGNGSVAYAALSGHTAMNPATLDGAGGGQPHNNLQPYLVLTYIIALQGIYPARP